MENLKAAIIYLAAITSEHEYDLRVLSLDEMISLTADCLFGFTYEDASYPSRALCNTLTSVMQSGKSIVPFKSADGSDMILTIASIDATNLLVLKEVIYLALDITERSN